MTTDDFVVELAAHRVLRGDEVVRLTPTEWSLLELLVRNPGKLVPQKQLLTEVWGPAYEHETHYLRVYLAQLRRKLEPDPAHPEISDHRARGGVPVRAVGSVAAEVYSVASTTKSYLPASRTRSAVTRSARSSRACDISSRSNGSCRSSSGKCSIPAAWSELTGSEVTP